MPAPKIKHDDASEPVIDCWLLRRHTIESNEEYVARNEATAIMMWDYMQHEVLIYGSAPARMALVLRHAGGQERTVASLDIRGRL